MAGVIENPVTGERIVIRTTGDETGGRLLVWELFLAPGGRVPSGHVHPEQEECFHVVAGRMRFRMGRRSVVAGPGEVVRVRPGTPHSFVNAGDETAHAVVETRPAMRMQALLETAATLSTRGRKPRRLPNAFDLVLFMREFEREVAAPYVPRRLVNAAVRPLAWLARICGLDARYQGSRGHGTDGALP